MYRPATPSITPTEYARLMDAAKRQANGLRDQAISNFWQRVGLAVRILARHGQHDKQQGA